MMELVLAMLGGFVLGTLFIEIMNGVEEASDDCYIDEIEYEIENQ